MKGKEEIVVTSLFIMFFGLILSGVDDWIGGSSLHGGVEPGPRFFPTVFCVAAIVILAGMLAGQIRDYRRSMVGANTVRDSKSAVILIAIACMVFLFVLGIDYLGFLLTGFLFSVGVQLVLIQGRPLKAALPQGLLFAAVMLVVNYVVFVRLLQVELPRGAGIIEQISYFLY